MSRAMSCPVCGHSFDPEREEACQVCPLRRGCPLVCCPSCGHVTVDPARSRLARAVAPLLRHDPKTATRPAGSLSLAEVGPGRRVTVADFLPGLPWERREQFRAYGLTVGRSVEVIRQYPVTVIEIGHTELALERELAHGVLVR